MNNKLIIATISTAQSFTVKGLILGGDLPWDLDPFETQEPRLPWGWELFPDPDSLPEFVEPETWREFYSSEQWGMEPHDFLWDVDSILHQIGDEFKEDFFDTQ